MKRKSDPISASELSEYRPCVRKGAAKYLTDTWPVTGRAFFATGRRFHGMVEQYWKTGRPPVGGFQFRPDPLEAELRKMFVASLPFLPHPKTHRLMEVREDFELEGLPFQVKADWVGDRSGSPWVVDLKTSVNPKQYGLWNAPDKYADPQTALYAWQYLRHGGRFSHVYVAKTRQVMALEGKPDKGVKTPVAYESILDVTALELERALVPILGLATVVWNLRQAGERDPLTLPGVDASIRDDRDSPCQQYGGCPHYSRCWPKSEYEFAGFGDVMEVGMAFVLKSKGAQTVVQSTPAQVEIPAQVADAEPTVAALKALAEEPAPVPAPAPAAEPVPEPVTIKSVLAQIQAETGVSDEALGNALKTLLKAYFEAYRAVL